MQESFLLTHHHINQVKHLHGWTWLIAVSIELFLLFIYISYPAIRSVMVIPLLFGGLFLLKKTYDYAQWTKHAASDSVLIDSIENRLTYIHLGKSKSYSLADIVSIRAYKHGSKVKKLAVVFSDTTRLDLTGFDNLDKLLVAVKANTHWYKKNDTADVLLANNHQSEKSNEQHLLPKPSK